MRITFGSLFILAAVLVHYSEGQFCGTHQGSREYIWDGSSDMTQITNETEFQQNLVLVFNYLIAENSETLIEKHGKIEVSYGLEPNRAYLHARCIGYVDYYNCLGCIFDAASKLKDDCMRLTNSAIILSGDRCMARYSSHEMNNNVAMPENMIIITNNTLDVPLDDVNAFNDDRYALFNALASKTKANKSDDHQMFAAGKWYDGSNKKTIYGAAQCSWDLSAENCDMCLAIVSKKLGQFFDGIARGSIVGPSCNFQYDIKSFIDDNSLVFEDLSPPLPPSLASPPSPQVLPPLSTGGGANKALLVVYILFPLVIISIITFVGVYMFLRKKKRKTLTKEVEIVGKVSDEDESSFGPDIKAEERLRFSFRSISAATDNFSEAYKLGEGGFGDVYKGKLQNGDEIAVKRLSQASKQGELEFTNEVTLLVKLQHRNLVKLLGFCLKGKERILIYEFVANSSLDKYIFDPIKRVHLNWDRLYKIIGGVARGLLYLHEDSRLRIIHRDLKSSNILLDNEMTPKISDFGMARLFLTDETQGKTSKIVGTYGYMAPEYLMHGQFSTKSDVFSFGVLLLEIICGRRNASFRVGNIVENLLSSAWKSWQEGTVSNLIDPTLKSETSITHEVMICIHISLLCTQEDATQRPTMASVVNMLTNLSTALPIPSKPFSHPCNISQETPLLQDYDSGLTVNSSGSKNKSSNMWSTEPEVRPR